MIKIESYGKSRVAAGLGRSAITTAILSAQTQRTVHNTETSFDGGVARRAPMEKLEGFERFEGEQ
jgi:hypothetical protein